MSVRCRAAGRTCPDRGRASVQPLCRGWRSRDSEWPWSPGHGQSTRGHRAAWEEPARRAPRARPGGNEGFLEERTQQGHLCPIGIGQVRNWAQELSPRTGDDPGNVQPNLPGPGRSWRGQAEGRVRKCLILASMQEESILRAPSSIWRFGAELPRGTHVPPDRPLHPSGHREPKVPTLATGAVAQSTLEKRWAGDVPLPSWH